MVVSHKTKSKTNQITGTPTRDMTIPTTGRLLSTNTNNFKLIIRRDTNPADQRRPPSRKSAPFWPHGLSLTTIASFPQAVRPRSEGRNHHRCITRDRVTSGEAMPVPSVEIANFEAPVNRRADKVR
jgi:hypothetical protein